MVDGVGVWLAYALFSIGFGYGYRGIRKEHVTSLDELLTHHHGMVSEAVY